MGMTHGNAEHLPAPGPADLLRRAGRGGRGGGGGRQAVPRPRQPADRKRARLKYVIHDWGVEKFREVFARDYWPKPVRLPRELPVTGRRPAPRLARRRATASGSSGLSVENGRIKDEGTLRLRTGLRAIVERFKPSVRHHAAAGRAALRPRRREPAGDRQRC